MYCILCVGGGGGGGGGNGFIYNSIQISINFMSCVASTYTQHSHLLISSLPSSSSTFLHPLPPSLTPSLPLLTLLPSRSLFPSLPLSPLQSHITTLDSLDADSLTDISPDQFTAIQCIWADEGVKKCFEQRNKFQISDSAKQ